MTTDTNTPAILRGYELTPDRTYIFVMDLKGKTAGEIHRFQDGLRESGIGFVIVDEDVIQLVVEPVPLKEIGQTPVGPATDQTEVLP